jgi:hypothetical protein
MAAVALRDLTQRQHALLRNFPATGRRHRRGAADLHRHGVAALPARFSRVYRTFAERGLTGQVTFISGGKLGLPDNAIVAFALGCDMVNVAREAMLAIGCIQAQKCHTDTCPTGVATQNDWLTRGLDPQLKSVRAANYIKTLRRDLVKVAEACGVAHTSLIDAESIEVLDGRTSSSTLREVYGYQPGWGLPGPADREEITRIMTQEPRRAAAPQPRRQPSTPSRVPQRPRAGCVHRASYRRRPVDETRRS